MRIVRPSQRVVYLDDYMRVVEPVIGISWLLRDEFTTPLAAGSVNGTAAEPGPGTRTVVDTGNNLSIGGGVLSISGIPGWGDPRLDYDAQTRVAGLTVFQQVQLAATNTLFACGWIDTGSLARWGFRFNSTASIVALSSRSHTDNILFVGPYAGATAYVVAVTLRTSGAYLFVKGGIYTNWTLLWLDGRGNAASVAPNYYEFSAALQSDFMRVPDVLWLPTPLAYDSFTRANGALGNTEATGPDAQAVAVRAWQSGGATWAVAGNEAVNTPTQGGDTVINGGFDSDTAGWGAVRCTIASIAGGQSGNCLEITDTGGGAHSDQVAGSDGNWYFLSFYHKNGTVTGNVIFETGGNIGDNPLDNVDWAPFFGSGRGVGTTSIQLYCGAGTTLYDTIALKPLTLNMLFSAVEVSTADVVCQVEIDTIAGTTQAGLVLNLDDQDSPANFVIAYHDGKKARLEKCVAGTYTSIIVASAGYIVGATLVVVKEGTSYSLYYNNVKIGSTSTISDAGIVDNTMFGLFSTYSGNQLDNFLVMPRGTGGEYSELDKYSG